MVKQDIMKQIEERHNKARSAWDRGVMEYAKELISNIPDGFAPTEKMLLNGAENWNQYSYGGCTLICNHDICERLCPPSEIKRKKHGDLDPNIYETWIDVQARALKQAAHFIMFCAWM